MESFTKLEAWQTGLHLVKEIYVLTRNFPKSEMFGITSQLRRASTSIIANIAEGFSRNSPADKAYKYTIARGECSEVQTFLIVGKEIGLIPPDDAHRLINICNKAGRLLSGLIHKHSPHYHPTPHSPSP